MAGAVVVDVRGQRRHGAVAGVAAEPDLPAAALDGPAGPERVAFVEGGAGARVLAGEAADMREEVAGLGVGAGLRGRGVRGDGFFIPARG